jgi:predicted naringenin-chalcone synthase
VRPRILSIATSTPPRGLDQRRAADLAVSLSGADAGRHAALRALFERAGVDHRGLVFCGEGDDRTLYAPGAAEPTTADRMREYERAAAGLAAPACRDALGGAGVAPREVTHVVVASCTGFFAPGLDQCLVHALGLDPGVKRTLVGFMGCHAAINALRVAGAVVSADPAAIVLVCCAELCGLHFAYGQEPQRWVANALFADGAAAAVVAARAAPGSRAILADASIIVPETADLMTWRIGDHGFEMTLSPRVPDVLAQNVPRWVDGVLAGVGLSRREVGGWALHPGGPRVVAALARALGLDEASAAPSLGVLRRHGNMSSPSVLFILEDLRRAGVAGPLVALAFGPGLAGEAMVVGPA